MAAKGRTAFNKRMKERARQEKKQEKAEKRAQRNADKPARPETEGEDPDIAGIVPGPQPHPFYDEEA